MFVAVEFQNMRSRCPVELEKLLDELSIPVDWSGDEYRIYERLDAELEQKICALMKSSSIIEGYTKLLKLGGVGYDFSELDSELLDKIISNGDKILAAVREANDNYDAWQADWGNVSPAHERNEISSVTAFNVSFDYIFSKLKNSKSLIKQNAPKAALACISDCIRELEGNEIPVEDISELLRKVEMTLRGDEERTICLKIKKRVQVTEKKIPPAPPEPAFTVSEADDALNILRKVNDITKKIAR